MKKRIGRLMVMLTPYLSVVIKLDCVRPAPPISLDSVVTGARLCSLFSRESGFSYSRTQSKLL